MKKSFAALTTLIVIFLMVFSFHPQVVFADGETPTTDEPTTVQETPPPDEATAETDPATEQTDTVETPSNEETTPEAESTAEGTEAVSTAEPGEATPEATEPVSTIESDEATPVQTEPTETASETPEQTETASEQPEQAEEADAPTASQIMDQAPEGTQLVVVGNEGQVEPLVSQEAADIIKAGDPIWCPDGVTNPQANTNGCTDSWTSFDDLLTELQNNTSTYTGPGIIYVAYNYDSSLDSDVEIDGSVLTTLGNITIQGGWDFSTQALSTTTPSSTFNNVSFAVSNWSNDVFINNITLNSSDYGLEVDTTGNVFLSNVDVTDTVLGDGISVDAGGNVSLTNVNSTSNEFNGATINSGGTVTVDNSSFEDNGSYNSSTNSVEGFGIEADATGDVEVRNTSVTGNYQGGANFNTDGNITLAQSVFSNNTSYSTTGVPLGYGIEADAGGAITITNVFADGNYEYGSGFTAIGNVVVQSNSSFSNNTIGEGLSIETDGTITLNSVAASNNGGSGAILDSNSSVDVSNSTFSNNAGGSYTAGVEITSPGPVSLTNVTVNSNQDDGAGIETSSDVELNNVSSDSNGWDGVYISGQCTTVYLTNGAYTNNGFAGGGYGLNVENSLVLQSGSPVFSNNFMGNISQDLDPCFIVREPKRTNSSTGVVFSNNIPVSSGQKVSIPCGSPQITITTPKETKTIFTNMCGYDVFLVDEEQEKVYSIFPPARQAYVNGVSITLLKENQEIKSLPDNTSMLLSFLLPEDGLQFEYTILYWDGFQWVEVGNSVRNQDRLGAMINSSGTYILVQK